MKVVRKLLGALGSLAIVVGTVSAQQPQVLPENTNIPTISPNQQLANRVAQSIAQSLPEKGYSIDVIASNGRVLLRGVATNAQMDRAVNAAQAVAGVRGVASELTPAAIQTNYQDGPIELAPAQPESVAMTDPVPQHVFGGVQYDAPHLPPHAWPAHAPYPNYSAVQYPTCYPKESFPHIGPFTPYPEPPLDWRKVSMHYKMGHWWLHFHKPCFFLRSFRYFH